MSYLLQRLRVILLGVSVGVKPNDKAYTAIQVIKMVSTHSQPVSGLAAARMSALRSRDSFESRFSRKPQTNKLLSVILSPPASLKPSEADEALASTMVAFERIETQPRRSSNQSPTPQILNILSLLPNPITLDIKARNSYHP